MDELNREETNNGSSSNVLLSYLVDPKGDGVGKHNAGLGQEDDDVGCEERPLKVQKLLVQELTGLVQDHQVELEQLLAALGHDSSQDDSDEDEEEEEEEEEDDSEEDMEGEEYAQVDNAQVDDGNAFYEDADDFDPHALYMSDDEDSEYNPHDDDANSPNAETIKAFRDYVGHAYTHFAALSPDEMTAVRIMSTLIRKKASLDTYDAVMEWHLRETGQLEERQKLGDCKAFISRKKLMQKLRKRYHMDNKYAQPETIVLPHSKTKVDVWKHDARDLVLSIITDPRWEDKDWLYFDDDPFAPPPEDLDYIADLNTGEAYLETYRRLITKPRQILVALPLYIDGAVTGQFDKLQVTALKMSISMLNRKARDKEHAWRTLGYVSNYAKEDSRGKKIFIESGHVAASELYMDETDDEEGEEGINAAAEDDLDKAMDYHAILEVLLESMKALIDEGMVIDLYYNGKLYKNVELVFFVPFVKCDGVLKSPRYSPSPHPNPA